MSELNYDPTDPDKMRLPVGTTCGDCAHILRCKAIFGHVETDTYCDWSPSRLLRARQAPTAQTGEQSTHQQRQDGDAPG